MAVEDRFPGSVRVDGAKKFMNVGQAFIECELKLIFLGVTGEEAAALAGKFVDEHPNGVNVKILDDGDGDADGMIIFRGKLIEADHQEMELENEDAVT